MVEIGMKTAVVIPDGEHEGIISNVSDRTTEYEGEQISYVNIEIETSDVKDNSGNAISLNCSAPANLTKTPDGSPNSKLARILVGLGYELDKMTSISTESLFTDLGGKKVKFLTVNETNERGTFAKVVDRSLKLV